ncbi:MAG TPA: hypothetical protein ACQGQH_08170 [Xylella sp.]
MLDVLLMSIAPTIVGWLACQHRIPRLTHAGLAVGQVPMLIRRKPQAIRQEVSA